MAKSARPVKPRFFATPAAFRTWLEQHHATRIELFVGYYKVGSGKPSMTWSESVDEALCFGWIDGRRNRVGADAYTIRFTPRKATSFWSAVNVAKVAAMTAAGKMRPAGDAAYAKRTDARTGVYAFERDKDAELPPAMATRLAANRKASAFFAARPPWYRRAATHWVISAKREATRERRFEQLLRDSAGGRTIPPLTR